MFRRQSDRGEKFLAAAGWVLAVLTTFMFCVGVLFLASDPYNVDPALIAGLNVVTVLAIGGGILVAIAGILIVLGAERADRRRRSRTNLENRSRDE